MKKEIAFLSHQCVVLNKRIKRKERYRSHLYCIQANYRLRASSSYNKAKLVNISRELCGLNNKIESLHRILHGVEIRLGMLSYCAYKSNKRLRKIRRLEANKNKNK